LLPFLLPFCDEFLPDIATIFDELYYRLADVFLPFCSQLVFNIITKLAHILAFLLPFLLPFCDELLPDIATIFDELYYRLAAIYCHYVLVCVPY